MDKYRDKVREMGYDPTNITEEERKELIKKLDEDVDQFIEERKEKGKAKMGDSTDTNEKSVDEIVESLSNHPAFLTEIDYSKPLSDAMQGLIDLKYESEDPVLNATSYKEEGNNLFKEKKYKLAIDNYTEGIKIKAPDRELNAILYSNRAACQFHIQNYRSSLNDSIMARKFKPDHLKAIVRGAQCCFEMQKYADAIKWCDSGFLIDQKDQQLLKVRNKAEKLRKEKEKENRKEQMRERKANEEENKILKCIESRGIRLAMPEGSSGHKVNPLLLTSLELHNPSNAKVHIDTEGIMYWPVLFLYPEHSQSDYIESFCETHSFIDHIKQMFSPESPPAGWDIEHTYTPDSIEVYFENKENETVYKLKQNCSLLKALQHKKFVVHAGTPCFYLVAKGTMFYDSFIKRHCL